MAADIEAPGEKIIPNIGAHHVGKVLGAGGSDPDAMSFAQNMTQRIFCSQAAKNISGADEQDTGHVEAYAAEIEIMS